MDPGNLMECLGSLSYISQNVGMRAPSPHPIPLKSRATKYSQRPPKIVSPFQ